MATRGAVAAALAVGMACALFAAPASAKDLTVTALTDGVDAHPGDGLCATADGACTLRAAVQEADALSSADTIVLPAGRLLLTIPQVSPLPQVAADAELDAAHGDLDISGTLTIRGAGADRTTIDAGRHDRAFAVQPGAAATFQDLEVTRGDATVTRRTTADIALGGGILNNGTATLERVALVGNRADGGGGMFTIPGTTIHVRDSLIADNIATEGGGLRVDSGGEIVNTTITGNRLTVRDLGLPGTDEITGYGGGIDHRGGDNLTIVNSTIARNSAYKAGGGLSSGQDYAPVVPATLWPFRVYLLNTIVAGNTAGAVPSDCHVSQMVIESRGHNLDSDGTCNLGAGGDLPEHDPLLGPLAAGGGPTATLALLPGSPAIDAGQAAGCPATDQRGVTRSACDIGAFEYVAPAPSCVTPRVLVIRLPRGIRSARVVYAGRRAAVTRRRGGAYARVDLRGLNARTVIVRIRGRAASGALVRRSRVLRVCG